MFKGLRFPEPLKRIALDVFDQIINGCEDLFVLFLPLKILLPSIFGPSGYHAAAELAYSGSRSLRSVSLPSSASLIERSRRAAFAGLLRRCTVSMRPS